jgi:hypothetical protein
MVLLPVAAGAIFFLAFLAFLGRRDDWRLAFLYAATTWGTAVVVITEGLGALHLLTRGAIALGWTAAALLTAALARRAVRAGGARLAAAPGGWLREAGPLERAVVAGAALLLALVVVVALACPPNMQDAIEYHLPRIVLWLSNRSVDFYPTPDYRQLVLGPYSEYAMLQFHALSGSDRFVNLVEAFSWFGAAIAASVIAWRVGAGRRGQLIAFVAGLTIPEAVLEASGAMNTAVVSFWIAAAVVFLIAYGERQDWRSGCGAAAAIGLACLTKGVAFAFLPFAGAAAWLMWPRGARGRVWRYGPLLLLAVALNLPQAFRAHDLTGKWLGAPFPAGGHVLDFGVEHPTVGRTIANALRGVAMNFNFPSARATLIAESATRRLIHLIGQDPDDPGALWVNRTFEIPTLSRHEIWAGNPVHFLLLVAAGIWILGLAARRRPADLSDPHWRPPLLLLAAIAGGFVLYSATLRWQPWGTRFQLPLFVLAAPLIGLLLERKLSARAGLFAGLLLCVYGCYNASGNRVRSLIPANQVKWSDVYRPRAALYYTDNYHQTVEPAQRVLVDAVNDSGCADVGWESYHPEPDAELAKSPKSFFIDPLLALTGTDGRNRRAWYAGVRNLSAKYPQPYASSEPCLVVCLGCGDVPDRWTGYTATVGPGRRFGADVVFRPSR